MTKQKEKQHNPYVGPRPFEEGETLYGRDREAKELTSLIISERVVVLYSPSGAGKTSLVQAKLIPAMKAEKFQVLPVCRPGVLAEEPPQDKAINPLCARLIADCEEGRPSDESELTSCGYDLAVYLGQRRWIQRDSRLKLLILDQFEEVLTNREISSKHRSDFFDQLGMAIENKRFWLLISMREEFSPLLDEFRTGMPTRLESRFRLGLLTPAAAKVSGTDAETGEMLKGPVSGPALDEEVVFQPEAVEALVDELTTVPDWNEKGQLVFNRVDFVEPLHLQVVCHRIWQELPDDVDHIGLDLVALQGERGIGNRVDTALMDYFALVMEQAAECTGVQERRVREWLQDEFITPQKYRRQVSRGREYTARMPEAIVEQLVWRALLCAERHGGSDWVEISHDRLVSIILQDNARWFNETLEKFQITALLWKQLHDQQDEVAARVLLLSEQDLEEADTWAAKHPDMLSGQDRRFLAESRDACEMARLARKKEEEAQRLIREKEQEKREFRRNSVIAALVVASLITVVSVLAALKLNQLTEDLDQELDKKKQLIIDLENARKLRQEAQKRQLIRKLLSEAARHHWRESNHELATLLTMHANQLIEELGLQGEMGGWATSMLRLSLAAEPFVYGGKLAGSSFKGGAPQGECSQSPLRKIALSHSLDIAVLPENGKQLKLVSLNDQGSSKLLNHDDCVLGMVFDQDDRHLAVATARSVFLVSALKPVSRKGSNPVVQRLDSSEPFTPNGVLCLSEDGRHLAAAAVDGNIQQWNLDGETWRANKIVLVSHGNDPLPEITALACAADGHWVAWGSREGEVGLLALDETKSSREFRLGASTDDWPLRQRELLIERTKALDKRVIHLGYLSSQKWLVATYRHGPPRIFDLGTDSTEPPAAYLAPQNQIALDVARDLFGEVDPSEDLPRYTSAEIDTSGHRLAVGGGGGLIGYWDLETINSDKLVLARPRQATDKGVDDREEKKRAHISCKYTDLRGMPSAVQAVAFVQPKVAIEGGSDTWILAVDAGSNLRWWAPNGAGVTVYTRDKDDKREKIYGLSFLDDDGSRLAAAGRGSTVFKVGREPLSLSADKAPQLPDLVRSMKLAREAKTLVFATGTKDDKKTLGSYSWIQHADAKQDMLPKELSGKDHIDGQWATATTTDGLLMLTAGWDGRAVLWNNGEVSDSATWPKVLPLYDAEGRENRVPILSADIFRYADRTHIVAGTRDGTVHLWHLDEKQLDVDGGITLRDPIHRSSVPIRALAYSPDGRFLLAGDENGFLWSWNVEDDGTYSVGKPFPSAHQGIVYDIAFDNRGSDWAFATGGGDGKVYYFPSWIVNKKNGNIDFDAAREWVLRFEGPRNEVLSVALSPDGELLAAGDRSGSVHLWLVDAGSKTRLGSEVAERACGVLTRQLSCREWERFVGETIPYRPVCTLPQPVCIPDVQVSGPN